MWGGTKYEVKAGLQASAWVPGESAACAPASAFAFRVFVRLRRVGAPVGSESDGDESDDEFGGDARRAKVSLLQSLEQRAEATSWFQKVMVISSYCGGTKR